MTTEQLHPIKIDGLPDGYRISRIKIQKNDGLERDGKAYYFANVVLEKIQPRRIVLEETDEDLAGTLEQVLRAGDTRLKIDSPKIWRVVEEEK